jgi:hypothetical protein
MIVRVIAIIVSTHNYFSALNLKSKVEKTLSKKSRDTVPLKVLSCEAKSALY